MARLTSNGVVCVLLGVSVWCISAQAAPDLGNALTGGKPTVNVRPRYEHVEQDGKPRHANAFTMRTLLGWRTGQWHGLSVYAEGINVLHFGDKRYNDNPARTTSPYPLVADPDSSDVNQLYLEYAGVPDTIARVGRQSIKLDNVRFIGNVEFRQVMQVFNGVTVENNSLPNTRLYAGYLMRQKTVFDTEREIDAPIFNARYTWKPGNAVVGYAYLHDQANTGQATGFPDSSNKIFGVRADGAYALGDPWKLLYTAEYARQDDYSGGDPRIDADYYHVGIGAQYRDIFLRLNQEVLGSNNGRYGFQTPLGTNHLFQGWADQFLTTPATGIRDAYVSGGFKLFSATTYFEWHRFRSDFGDLDLGKELDLGITYPIPMVKGLTGKVELADYRSGDPAAGKVDVRKFWLTLIYNY